jgi:hypothetical protein
LQLDGEFFRSWHIFHMPCILYVDNVFNIAHIKHTKQGKGNPDMTTQTQPERIKFSSLEAKSPRERRLEKGDPNMLLVEIETPTGEALAAECRRWDRDDYSTPAPRTLQYLARDLVAGLPGWTRDREAAHLFPSEQEAAAAVADLRRLYPSLSGDLIRIRTSL